MKTWLIFVLVLIFATGPAMSQSIRILGGEHSEYSRLVFYLPQKVEWSLEKGDKELVVKFDMDDLRIDAETVFDRMSKARVRAISLTESGDGITIELGCACDVSSFWHNGSMFVVDVLHLEEALEPIGAAVAQKTVSPHQTTPIFSKTLDLPLRNGRPSARLVKKSLPVPTESERQDRSVSAVPKPSDLREREAFLKESQNRLVTQLGRAASQGLLSPNASLGSPAKHKSNQKDEHGNNQPKNTLQVELPNTQSDPVKNLSINAITSIDRDYLENLNTQMTDLTTSSCLDVEAVDVGGWGNGDGLPKQLGALRASLTNEIDRLNPDAVVELAKVYLHFGFGSEAKAVLDILPGESDLLEVLTALSSIMDDDQPKDKMTFQKQLNCDTPAALWAALSHRDLPKDEPVNTDAILRSFAALPVHLRAHVGPDLSHTFLRAGMVSESGQVLRVLGRSEESQSPNEKLARAELKFFTGDAEAANKHLKDVIEGNAEPAPEALLRSIENALEADQDVSFDLAQLVGAFAHEHQTSDLGQRLSRAFVLGLGASGSFEEAYAELLNYESGDNPSPDALRAELAGMVVAKAGDLEFLRYALAGQFGNPEKLSVKTAMAVSQKLGEARFYAPALTFLERDFTGQSEQEARTIRADLFLSLNQPRQAEVELLGLVGRDIDFLRARAKSMVGKHKLASDLYQSLGKTDEAMREAWLARDWSRVSESDSVYGIFPGPESSEVNESETGLLTRSTTLLETATRDREAIEALLLDLPQPQPQP